MTSLPLASRYQQRLAQLRALRYIPWMTCNDPLNVTRRPPLIERRLPSYDEANKEHRLFVAAIEEYESRADEKFKTHININQSHTWEEVLKEVSKVEEKYKVAGVKGFWGSLRKRFREFGENHKAFTAWTGLLPTESHYISVVCGGLKLIIGAAARLNDLRDEIFRAIVEIPLRLSETKVLLQEFQKSEALQKCSLDLYVATLKVLGHVLYWYSVKAIRKILGRNKTAIN